MATIHPFPQIEAGAKAGGLSDYARSDGRRATAKGIPQGQSDTSLRGPVMGGLSAFTPDPASICAHRLIAPTAQE